MFLFNSLTEDQNPHIDIVINNHVKKISVTCSKTMTFHTILLNFDPVSAL